MIFEKSKKFVWIETFSVHFCISTCSSEVKVKMCIYRVNVPKANALRIGLYFIDHISTILRSKFFVFIPRERELIAASFGVKKYL